MGRRVVLTNRFDDVADELEANWLRLRSGVEVHNSAPHEELAVLIDRILRNKTGIHQAFAQGLGIDLDAGFEQETGIGKPRGVAQSRGECPCGRNHQSRCSGGKARECAGPGRRHLKVGCQAAVRVHLLRREGQHGLSHLSFGEAEHRAEKKPRIAGHLFDVRVSRHHQHHHGILG